MNVCLQVCLCTTCMQCLQRPEEGIKSPGPRVIDNCGLPCGTQVFCMIHLSSPLICSLAHSTNTYATPVCTCSWKSQRMNYNVLLGCKAARLLGEVEVVYGDKTGSDTLFCFLVHSSCICFSVLL